MRVATEHLPPLAAELAEAIGLPATLRLVELWGGVRLYVPEELHAEHALIRELGAEAARALSTRYARERIDVPRCDAAVRAARDIEIRERHRTGASARELALTFGLTERHVWRILAAGAEAERSRQAALF